MGPRINTRYYEYFARISPDKKYMFFTRANGWGYNSNRDTGDIYWVELKEYLHESYRSLEGMVNGNRRPMKTMLIIFFSDASFQFSYPSITLRTGLLSREAYLKYRVSYLPSAALRAG